jgi:lipopolysaccharide/colanic/teichoic acid biosynthesis glycosyltransferase
MRKKKVDNWERRLKGITQVQQLRRLSMTRKEKFDFYDYKNFSLTNKEFINRNTFKKVPFL